MKISKKLKRILIILFVLAIGSIAFVYFQISRNNPIPIATPTPVVFELLKSVPESGTVTTILPTSALEFDFSKPIDPSTLNVVMKPYTPFTFDTSDDKKILFIKSNPAWDIDTKYQISLDVKSQDGESLSSPINYTLNITKQTDSNLTEPYYP